MLKLTYTENGFHLERLSQSLEEWVNIRVMLALRSATPLYVEPSTAAFLLPIDVPYLTDLEKLIEKENGFLELSMSDEETVEVSLQGTWITSDPEDEEGVFICLLSDRTEFFLEKLWQEAHLGAFVVNE
ncbi:conserved hypothetical protein [Gloeothece citriformis PCC 7424]|uniref:Uncharacterized protein n=1 Tax=Gloeothece citriformis (strain PCC 7424) TaxID=65393 RepID=B7KL83_GLOC7|nr:alr0857 family protein [Gloeothece citriformis]ACK72455.1 conserved hypothetical protein [Gloeothece citriformis PCC 7424]